MNESKNAPQMPPRFEDTVWIARLPLNRIVGLFNSLQDDPDIRDVIFSQIPVLARVRAALTSVASETPLPGSEELFEPAAASLVTHCYGDGCSEQDRKELAALMIRLSESKGQERLLALLKAVQLPSAQLSNGQIWQLVCSYVRQHGKRDRVQALTSMLERLDAERAGQILAEVHDDTAIKAYWPLLPLGVRQVLIGLGRGRIFNNDTTTGHTTADQSHRRASSSRRAWSRRQQEQQRQQQQSKERCQERARRTAGQRKRPGREARAALRLMVRTFGFTESMTYREAQRKYWRLAMQWHPDRAGNSPAGEQKIRDLNSAWDMAKVCFAR